MAEIYLGTIALEPNRWFGVTHDRWGTLRLSEWLDRIAEAGFNGIELWESHLIDATETEAESILAHPVPIKVFNTYTSFDEDLDEGRDLAAAWIRRSGAEKVKWNTGVRRDEAALTTYSERLARWAGQLPGVQLVCECHDGSAMDDSATAAGVLAAGGDREVSQAMLHTHDSHDSIREKFAAYGDRITHVHVNHLNIGSPKLSDIRDDLQSTVGLLEGLGFAGTWTVEFVQGTGGENDEPAYMLDQAVADLRVLRELLS
jgi:sugar phosphate isomerase/epimerase